MRSRLVLADDPAATGSAALEDLEGGVTSLWLELPEPASPPDDGPGGPADMIRDEEDGPPATPDQPRSAQVEDEHVPDEIDEPEDKDEDVDEDPSVTQLRTEMRDTTLGIGGTTIGVPDAESTKIVLEEDSEMLDDTEPMDTTM